MQEFGDDFRLGGEQRVADGQVTGQEIMSPEG
jgi:hypothetical protein